jgi:hypothetical protein
MVTVHMNIRAQSGSEQIMLDFMIYKCTNGIHEKRHGCVLVSHKYIHVKVQSSFLCLYFLSVFKDISGHNTIGT